MSNPRIGKFGWSRSDESPFQGAFDTREEAYEEAQLEIDEECDDREEVEVYSCEWTAVPIRRWIEHSIDIEKMLERVSEAAYEDVTDSFDEEWPMLTEGQANLLAEVIADEIEKAIREHAPIKGLWPDRLETVVLHPRKKSGENE